jgi:serine/threonine protein kinase/tetratricopeptide (TPR) repeat protein
MDRRHHQRALELFAVTYELSEEARRERLDRECGDDTAMREEVESLLARDTEDEGFLEGPALGSELARVAGAVTAPDGRHEKPGSVIGRYKLLQEIGEGGFGSVYMAEQTEPVHRKVALKVIKLGMDTKQVIARFEAERQALAMMDHPNIAKVLDGGATESGRPYFVMELVKGVPITEYSDSHDLSTADRLELFIDVCRSVQHAHQKGVIHRDIKPSNVLVTLHDGRPVPKVIDFGIAKATKTRLTDKTMFTEFRQLIGTPAYMSPEQAEMSGLDVDTRSDIYSLGVLLYELLTGTTPFDSERLRSASYEELQRIIREEEPDKPSTRLSSLVAVSGNGASKERTPSIEVIARHRRDDAAHLARSLRGDLDWVAMKCLEKDRVRRYETANGLAADIRRHLGNQPVEAGPPTAAYRVRKFVRRNRVMVTAGTMVVAALLAGTAGTTFGLLRAEQRRAEAETAWEREREQRELAETRENQTQKVSDFQAAMLSGIDVDAMGRGIKDRFREQVGAALEREDVGDPPDRRKRTEEEIESALAEFDQLAEIARAADVARLVLDEFVLARAADALEKRFDDQPLVQARLHFAIGKTYRKLGLYGPAETHLRAALEIRRDHYGPENAHAHVAECLYNLAGVMYDLGDRPAAEALYRESLAMWRELANDKLVAMTLEALGGMVMFQNKFAEADALLSESLRLNRELYGDDNVRYVGHVLGTLAVLRTKQRRLPEAEDLNRQILQMRRDHYGDQHPQVAMSLHNLAHVLRRQGKHAEAVELFRESLAIRRAVSGDDHPVVARTMYSLGYELVALGRRSEGEALYRQALAQQRKLLGDHHPDVRVTLRDLAQSRAQDGDHDESVTLLREALAIVERLYPEGHPDAWRRFSTMSRLGGHMAQQAKGLLSTDPDGAVAVFAEAEPLIIGGWDGLDQENRDRGLSFNLERKRSSLESAIAAFEFWHEVAPDRGWGDRAAERRARLEELPEP